MLPNQNPKMLSLLFYFFSVFTIMLKEKKNTSEETETHLIFLLETKVSGDSFSVSALLRISLERMHVGSSASITSTQDGH